MYIACGGGRRGAACAAAELVFGAIAETATVLSDATRLFRVFRLMCRMRLVGENNSQQVFVAFLDRVARVGRRASSANDEATMRADLTYTSRLGQDSGELRL